MCVASALEIVMISALNLMSDCLSGPAFGFDTYYRALRPLIPVESDPMVANCTRLEVYHRSNPVIGLAGMNYCKEYMV